MTHELHLHNDPFIKIKNRTKTIEMRLNDEKRKLIKVNDIIKFTNRSTNEEIITKVINLHYFPNFQELFNHFDKKSLGYNENENPNPSDLEIYYSQEEQNNYGVVAIEIEVI